MTRRNFALAVLLLCLSGQGASTAENTPYFASMKGDKTYMREGPGENYRIKWLYHRKALPVEVIASYDLWRRVRDMEGEIGWIHMVLLSRERTAVVIGEGQAPVYRRAEPDSTLVAEAAPGAIGRLKNCGAHACEVKFDGAEGWVERTRLWGVHDGEQF